MTRSWYADSRQAIQSVYGANWQLFTAMLAATSPHATVKANITLARKAYNELGEYGTLNPAHFTRQHAANLERAWLGVPPNGRKVRSFLLNLLGYEDCVTVDIWICRWATHQPHDLARNINPRQPDRHYDAIEHFIQYLARLDSITPAQKQAEIWCKTRGDSHSYADYLHQYRMF